jgi:predicted CopG family antitoxin
LAKNVKLYGLLQPQLLYSSSSAFLSTLLLPSPPHSTLYLSRKILKSTYIHSYMKNIMVRDEVYEKLQRMKKGKESFSDVILRLIEERKRKGIEVLEKYAGKLADEELERVVTEERKKFRVRNFDI